MNPGRQKFIVRHRSTRGFTLLELMLATAIGAIVLLVINTTFFSALRLHNTTHARIDESLVVERALGIIRQDLAGIMLPANPQATTTTLSGQLQTDALSTNELDNTSQRITPDIYTSSGRIDGWSTFADVQTVAYYLSPAADGGPTKDLVRAVTRNLLPASAEVTLETRTLLTGVSAAGISYFDGSYWADTWDSTTTSTLPAAIKFSLVLTSRDGTNRTDSPPLELVVPVLVMTTTSAQAAVASTP